MPRSSVREMGAHSCPPINCTQEGAWSTDHLHTIAAELVSCLRSSPEAFDVVASSDTLVYFGDLREVLAATRTSLRPGAASYSRSSMRATKTRSPRATASSTAGTAAPSRTSAKHSAKPISKSSILRRQSLRREGGPYVAGLVVLQAHHARRVATLVAE